MELTKDDQFSSTLNNLSEYKIWLVKFKSEIFYLLFHKKVEDFPVAERRRVQKIKSAWRFLKQLQIKQNFFKIDNWNIPILVFNNEMLYLASNNVNHPWLSDVKPNYFKFERRDETNKREISLATDPNLILFILRKTQVEQEKLTAELLLEYFSSSHEMTYLYANIENLEEHIKSAAPYLTLRRTKIRNSEVYVSYDENGHEQLVFKPEGICTII